MRSAAVVARVFAFACVVNLAAFATVPPGVWRISTGEGHAMLPHSLQQIVPLLTPAILAALVVAAGVAWWLCAALRPLLHALAAEGHVAPGAHSLRGCFAPLYRRHMRFMATVEDAHVMQRERLADIAHELRTPLTLLHGEIEAIHEGLRAADADTLALLRGETRRLIQLVGELDGVRNAIPARYADPRQPADLAALVGTVIASYRTAIAARGLQVRFFHDPGCIALCAPHRLIQLFGNLMKNSVLHTAENGQAQICVCKRHDNILRVVWEDSSPGVQDADLPQLTRRGFRASEDAPGSGLGLAIVAEIAQEHGARMEASHSLLGGLRWTIDFPRNNFPQRARA